MKKMRNIWIRYILKESRSGYFVRVWFCGYVNVQLVSFDNFHFLSFQQISKSKMFPLRVFFVFYHSFIQLLQSPFPQWGGCSLTYQMLPLNDVNFTQQYTMLSPKIQRRAWVRIGKSVILLQYFIIYCYREIGNPAAVLYHLLLSGNR